MIEKRYHDTAWKPVDISFPGERWRWVHAVGTCSPGARIVLSYIALKTDGKSGMCRLRAVPPKKAPGDKVPIISTAVELAERAVRSHLKALAESGALDIRRRGPGPSEFRIRFEKDPRTIEVRTNAERVANMTTLEEWQKMPLR